MLHCCLLQLEMSGSAYTDKSYIITFPKASSYESITNSCQLSLSYDVHLKSLFCKISLFICPLTFSKNFHKKHIVDHFWIVHYFQNNLSNIADKSGIRLRNSITFISDPPRKTSCHCHKNNPNWKNISQ